MACRQLLVFESPGVSDQVPVVHAFAILQPNLVTMRAPDRHVGRQYAGLHEDPAGTGGPHPLAEILFSPGARAAQRIVVDDARRDAAGGLPDAEVGQIGGLPQRDSIQILPRTEEVAQLRSRLGVASGTGVMQRGEPVPLVE